MLTPRGTVVTNEQIARAKSATWIRVDAGDGAVSDVTFARVLEVVSDNYSDPWLCILDALDGAQIRCPFAYYRIDRLTMDAR